MISRVVINALFIFILVESSQNFKNEHETALYQDNSRMHNIDVFLVTTAHQGPGMHS
jgi:hypothetical protein